MHDWKYLNTYIDLNQKLTTKKQLLANQFIEACQNNEKTIIKHLIKEGAYVNSTDNIFSPLMACVEYDNFELANFILKLGSSPNIFVNNTDAFWLSLKRKKYNFLQLFFDSKYKPNREKEQNKTMLIMATEYSDLKSVEIIAPKVNVNEREKNGNTALHYNLSKMEPTTDDLLIGKILLSCGADSNSRNLDGITPEQLTHNEEFKIVIEHHNYEKYIERIAAEKELLEQKLTEEEQNIPKPRRPRPKI